MPTFEWDPEKNKKNLSKHNVDFREAQEIYDDKNAIEKLGTFRDEPRIIRIGKTTAKFILVVVYTMRDVVVRLISARQASKEERNAYLENSFKQQKDEN
ncbi:MAG: BrnT family toxin [Haliscomenobacter sp.]|uniref:BrnT family toxin n=1 Tax=Haliscomenobacter sp. TaxID=2717303 RepID=UPI0029ADD2E1|nr:BrnT family toxin [Haliscomenobacter sp.]MDX2071975.1 BrnT family toxin [Haliscomenobacter sp.]